MNLSGLNLSGVNLITDRTFSSVEGLMIDMDADALWNPLNKEWSSLVDGKTFRLSDPSTAPYVTSTSDGILFDGVTGPVAISMTLKVQDADWVKSVYNEIHIGAPHGIYLVGKIEGTPATVVLFGGRSSAPATVDALRFINNSGSFRGNTLLGSVSTNFGNITTGSLKCWQQTLRENNQLNNLKFRQDSSLITQVTKNNVASAVDVVSILNNVPAGVKLTVKKFLLYKWTGKTTAQVNSLDLMVRDLITKKYGIIL